MDPAAMAWITDAIVGALARGDRIDPASLTFLLRHYVATDAADLRDALEPALARALDDHRDAQTSAERAQWLTLFALALQLSEDDRLRDAAVDLVSYLRGDWGRPNEVSDATGIEACLVAAPFIDPQTIVPAAIDELERSVAIAYRVGGGLVERSGGDRLAWLQDHVDTASALLTAFDVTSRLPYSMLAEELVQHVRRDAWDAALGWFAVPGVDAGALFRVNCAAAVALSRLAHLHARDDYRTSAVVASQAAYGEDARRILLGLRPSYREYSASTTATYGLALLSVDQDSGSQRED